MIPIIYYQLQPLKTLYMVTVPFRIQVFACEKSSAISELLAQFLGLSGSPNTFDDNLGSQTKHILQKNPLKPLQMVARPSGTQILAC